MRTSSGAVAPLLLLFLTIVIAVPCFAQVVLPDTDWTGYTSGLLGDTLEQHVDAVVRQARQYSVEAASRREALLELYVRARQDSYTTTRYAEELEELGVGSADAGERVALQAMDEHLLAISGVLAQLPPLPGGDQYRAAETWLAAVARMRGIASVGLGALVDRAAEYLASAASTREAEGFVEAIGMDTAFIPDGVGINESASIIVRVWWLTYLAAPVAGDRLAALDRLGEALASVDDTLAREARAAQDAERGFVSLRNQIAPTPRVLALVRPGIFADASRLGGDAARAGEFLALIAEADPNTLVVLCSNVDLSFAVDMLHHLLPSASDELLFEFGRTAGVTITAMRRLALAIGYVAAAVSREGIAFDDPPAELSVGFQSFLDDGRTYLRSASRWVDSDEPRAGDAFRWSMLPVVSNPYAQYLLVNDESLSRVRDIVQGFADEVYQDALLRSERSSRIAFELVPEGSSVLPIDRVYRATVAGVPADRLYLAFVTVAQGEDTLPPGFDQRFGRTGLTVGGVWSHSHGLHVLPMVTDTTEDLLRGLAADWIALAWSAEAEPVMIGYEFRAIAALEVGFDSVLTPLLRQGAIVDLSAVSPALARTGELFDLCTSFAAEPEWVLDELLQVYESLPGPDGIRAPRPAAGASPYSVLPQVIAAQLDRFAARLADVEVPDRRVLLRAAGGAR